MRRMIIASILGALAACTGGQSNTSGDVEPPPDSAATLEDGEPAFVPPIDEPRLLRSQAPEGRLHEVWLDPRGRAALTLDTAGAVQLWPAFEGERARLAPLTLPLQEPLWLSFARVEGEVFRAEEQPFTLATLDTTNTLKVFSIRARASGGHDGLEWRLVQRFSLAPDDPILEVHVLAGGQTLVALAEDHSIRVYDESGAELTRLQQPAFVPWQLYLGDSIEQDGKLRLPMAVLINRPLRVQPLELVIEEGKATLRPSGSIALRRSKPSHPR